MTGKCIECGQSTAEVIPIGDDDGHEYAFLCDDCDTPRTPSNPSPTSISVKGINYATTAFFSQLI